MLSLPLLYFMAGGLTQELADKVHVIRNLEDSGQPVVIQASMREAAGPPPEQMQPTLRRIDSRCRREVRV